MNETIQQIINGLSLGSTYALLALGLALLFSIMRLINFAHGELLTIGGYTMWALLTNGVPFWAVVPVTLVATTLAAVAMERIAFRPLRGASVVTLLITSFAVSYFIQNAFAIGISQEPEGVGVPNWLNGVFDVGPYTVSRLQVITTLVTFGALALLVVFLRRARLGIAMRAAAEDFPMVRLMGVRANRVVVAAFALSGFLAGIASVLYISQAAAVDPNTGTIPIIKAFIAVVIGGLGSLSGALIASVLVGLADALGIFWVPQASLAIVFAVLVVVLAIRPQGLRGATA